MKKSAKVKKSEHQGHVPPCRQHAMASLDISQSAARDPSALRRAYTGYA